MKMSLERKIERFDRKYKDKGGFAKFKEMVENLATLEEIGRHFGFSRQNTAGLYRSFFGRPYKEIQIKRRLKREAEMFSLPLDLDKLQKKMAEEGRHRTAKKIGYIKLVKKVAEDLGYEVKILRKRSGALVVFINGHKCAVSGTNTKTIYHYPKNHPPSVYYRFAVPSKKVDFCIFVIELEDHYTFYVIPYEKIKHLSLITLRDSYEWVEGKRGIPTSKYAQYRNRFDLLKEPKENPELAELERLASPPAP